jgi:uncharacterized protein (DUF58 family)
LTLRGGALVGGGALLLSCGWFAGWPELTALGAAALALVALSIIVVGPIPHVDLRVDQQGMRVTRGQDATIPIELQLSRRGRWLRIVDGSASAPKSTSPVVPRDAAESVELRLPVDTSERGEFRLGPYTVVHGDPWSIVRRVAGRADGGSLTVYPRCFPVSTTARRGQRRLDSDRESRWQGDDHFFTLRDYVLGDEPRMVHWRSSARAGKLVVKQLVASTATGTAVILDTDATAYGSDDQFGDAWLPERFEAAVEVAASLIASRTAADDQLHFLTTARASAVVSSAGGSRSVMDALAAVVAVPPVDCSPEAAISRLRRLRCGSLMLVTGTPGRRLVDVVRIARPAISPTLFRVGSRDRVVLAGMTTVDVGNAEELASL